MDDKKRIVTAIRDYLARERISREEFAFQTKLGKSTIDKLLTGLFSERTLAIVESHTRLSLRSMLADSQNERVAKEPRPAALTPPDRPSIAVLPFTSFGANPGQEFLADGITEDIITALTRLRWLFVIARNSSFVYKGKAVDVRQVAQELGVRYLLEGSARTAGKRIRITGQLIDAETGKHIWAEKYDGELKDVFAVKDDIAEQVVAAVEPHLYAEEGFRAASKQPDSIDAWGLVVHALNLTSKLDREQNEEAQTLLRRAIEMEPSYARAHALLGWTEWWAAWCFWNPDRRTIYRRTLERADQALSLDSADPWARMTAGLASSQLTQYDRALSELRTALHLNPSFALGRMVFGWALTRAGRFEEAIVESGRALRLSPLDNFSGFYNSIHGLALLGAQRFEEALPYLRASVADLRNMSGHYNSLISCCGHLGLTDEVQEYLAARSLLGPPMRLSVLREHIPAKFANKEVLLEGMRKAGVPE